MAVVVAVAAAAVWDELQESPGLQEDVEAWDAVSVHARRRPGSEAGEDRGVVAVARTELDEDEDEAAVVEE